MLMEKGTLMCMYIYKTCQVTEQQPFKYCKQLDQREYTKIKAIKAIKKVL